MNKELTTEQSEIVEFVRIGHNVLITGQAGTGKSTVVNAIRQECSQRGLKVGVVCSSGIACQVYENGVASTVHSYYGLGAADRPAEQVIQYALSNNIVCEKIRSLNVLIWDEASMSSARVFEIVNAIHHNLSNDELLDKLPFAGKQIVVVGDFSQLRPVPSCFDSGDFMFHSRVFEHAITHRFELTILLRQNAADKSFVHALKDLMAGTCSQETASFMSSLSREMVADLNERATHIFFKRNSVLLFNRSSLDKLPGDIYRFDAIFEGRGREMKWPGEISLFLKSSCKVMLVWNKSDKLKNGSMGTFLKVHEGKYLQIYFNEVGTVNIERETWIQRNRRGEIIGSACQFPVILAYAVTCHKSQGTELPAVVVHASKEFVPGLTYVAVSRVKSVDNLQVVGFKASHIIPADPEVINQCKRAVGENDPTLACCCMRPVSDENFFTVCDATHLPDADGCGEESDYQFPFHVSDDMVLSYFEQQNDDELNINAAQVFEQMERHASQLSKPPRESLDTISMLTKLKVESPQRSDFSRAENAAVEMLLADESKERVEAFIDVIWFHVFLAIEQHIVENPEEIIVKIKKSDFTTTTAKLHELFRSAEFSLYLGCLFGTSTCTAAQRSVGVQLSMATFWKFLDHLQNIVVKDRCQEVITFEVEEMAAAGRAKVRHVGGWAIRKVLEKSRNYVRANVHSGNSNTLSSVKVHHQICELIEEQLVASLAVLEKESQHKETLQVTEARQYRERGLIHIQDAVYQFFMVLESNRVRLLNDQALRREGEKMVEVAQRKLLTSTELKLKWQACFDGESIQENKDLIEMIRQSVIKRYVTMGTSQYLRDFRRSYDLKKSTELRKKVLERQQKNKEKTDSVPFKEILADRTQGKLYSHERLRRFVEKYSDDGSVLSRVYLKDNLVALCEAYGVGFRRNSTKQVLAASLAEAIRNNSSLPYITPVDDRQYKVVETVSDEGSGAVRIRLRLTGATEREESSSET